MKPYVYALAAALALTPALSLVNGTQANESAGKTATAASARLAQCGADGVQTIAAGRNGLPAPVPQYCFANINIYLYNALNTAEAMSTEQRVHILDAAVFRQQSGFLSDAIQRTNADVDSLIQNALATNPTAVPRLRAVGAELVAARAMSGLLNSIANQSELGPTYRVAVNATVAHLRAAGEMLPSVAASYRITPMYASFLREHTETLRGVAVAQSRVERQQRRMLARAKARQHRSRSEMKAIAQIEQLSSR